MKTSNAKDNLNLISAKISPLLDGIKAQILEVENLEGVPLVGTIPIQNYVNELFQDIASNIIDEINSQTNATVGTIRTALFEALSSSGLDILLNSDNNNNLSKDDILLLENSAEAIEFQFKIGKSFNPELPLAENLGLETLGLNLEGGMSSQLDFALTIGFGVDKDGNVFFNTGTPEDFKAQLKGNLVDSNNQPLNLEGNLRVISLNAKDNGSQLTSTFTTDLTSANADNKGRVKVEDLGGLNSETELNANADLKLKLNTGIGARTNDILPSIETDFNLIGWQYDSNNSNTPAPKISFNNVALDVGSLVEDFAGGVLEPVKDVLDPIQNVLEPFITPLPVIDLSFLDLARKSLGQIDSDTDKFVDVINTIAKLEVPTGDNGKISLGDFNITGGDIRSDELNTFNSTSATNDLQVFALTPVANDLKPQFIHDLEEIGFEFPILDLDKPESIVDLLLGKPDITLFSYETPKFYLDYPVPTITIPVFGPVIIQIGGEVEAGAQITFGYDSVGFASDDPNDLEDGFFVVRQDANPKDKDSRKNSTLYGEAEVTAAAGVGIGVISLTIGGGINLGLGFNFAQKYAKDGKVRGNDLIDHLPFCAFDTGGGLSVIIFGQMEIDLGFISFTERLELADISLIDFGSEPDHEKCKKADYFDKENPEPTPEQKAALVAAGIIDRQGNEIGNNIFISHEGGTWNFEQPVSTEIIKVEGTEIIKVEGTVIEPDPETYDKVTLIIIDGAQGNDTIEFINGVQAPGQVKGGDGNDKITTGFGNDFIFGGQGNDTIDGQEGKNTADYSSSPNGININLELGLASDDGYGNQDILSNIQNVQGSSKDDIILGNATDNYLNGGEGNDRLEGGKGDDVLLGGEGADTIKGGEDFDTITYLYSNSAVFVNLSNRNFLGDIKLPDGISPLFLNPYSGQGGSANGDFIDEVENISGSKYNDILVASNGDGIIDGWLGNDTIYAGVRQDILIGGEADELEAELKGKLVEDWLSYRLSNAGVSVDLKNNDFFGGYAEGDKLQTVDENNEIKDGNSFENLEGSIFSDSQLRGDDDKNIIQGLEGDDNIYGENGDDLIIGGNGADFLDGGDGENDTASYLNSPDKVIVDLLFNNGVLADAQGDTFANIENLVGSNFGDTLYGNDNNNQINPSLSNRQLDFVDGEGGLDTLLVNYSINDYGRGIYGGSNDGLPSGNIKHYDTDEITLLDEVTFEDIERIIVTGTIWDDTIWGGSGDDIIQTSNGNDYVDSQGGNDIINSGEGDDTLIGGRYTILDIKYDLIGEGFGYQVEKPPEEQEQEQDSLTGGKGADLFILGQSPEKYDYPYLFYTLVGDLDFASITDFNPTEGDKIQLPNCAKFTYNSTRDYSLVDSIGGTALYSKSGTEKIAFFENVYGLDLNASYFQYVGDYCPSPPIIK